jgi:hypothetical protein
MAFHDETGLNTPGVPSILDQQVCKPNQQEHAL